MSVSDTRITQLLREYEEVRSAAESAARDRKQLIYSHIPRIMEIDAAGEGSSTITIWKRRSKALSASKYF